MKPLRVYLSSTFEDLEQHRAAVFSALEKAGLAVARMEGYTAADERPLDLCLRDVAQSDIYVGLFAWRYGYVPPPVHGNPLGRSITELEYHQAEACALRKLLFFAHADTRGTWPDRFRDEFTGEGDRGGSLERLRRQLGTEKVATFFRTPDELATQVLAAIMRTGLSGRPYNVPPPPPKFVARPPLTTGLIDSLTGCGRPGANTVVQGQGGFGKTSLALDACHRAEVIRAFPNGILWTSLGERPDIAKTFADLYLSVTDAAPAATSVEAIGEALAKALGGREYLIVVDDAWRAEDVLHFLRLKGARLLICTRVRNLVEQAGEVSWPEIAVDEMSAEQAGALLARGFVLPGPLPLALTKLADRLGCWPLLLELANARLLEEHKRGRGDIVDCAAWLIELFRSRGVGVLDRRDSHARNAAVASSVAAGLEFAEAIQAGIARRAAELAIFPEDTAIPLSALTTLWSMDRLDVEEDILRPLDNLSILRWDRQAGEVRLHDVIRLVLAARLAGPRDVHRALIDAWGDLRCLPDDYAWGWIAYHLARAECLDQLRALLLDYDWIRAKLAATSLTALAADYDVMLDDREVRLVQRALQLSAHALSHDPDQLASQLHGRLLEQDTPGIRQLLTSAVRSSAHPWLRPVSASLARAAGPLLRTLRGHRSFILDAAVTPDGRRVISAAADNTLMVWSLATGTAERILNGHTSYVRRVVVTPDGRRAVSASLDKTVRVWNVEDGTEQLVFRGHDGVPEALAVTADSRCAISASNDGTMKVWELATGAERHTLSGHSGGITDIRMTADGRYLVSASMDSTVSVWDVEHGVERHTLGTRNWHAGQTVTTSTGRDAIYFPSDGVLELCDVDTGATRQTLVGHAGAVDSVAVTPDGRRIVSASRDKTLRVWDLESGAELHVLRGHSHQAAVVVTTPDGRHAISGSLDKTVRIWDLENGTPLATLAGHAFDIFFVAVTHDGRRIMSASSDNTIKVWDLESGAELGTLRAHTEQVRALLLTPDGRRAVSASNDTTLRVWDVDAVADQQPLSGHIGTVHAIAITADGRVAMTAAAAQTPLSTPDNTLKVWDVTNGVELVTLEGHREAAVSVAITPDSRRAVSAAHDHILTVWDPNAGVEVGTLQAQTDDVSNVAIAPDGHLAVSASGNEVTVWDLDSGTRIRRLVGHTAPVGAIVITQDGERVVSCAADGTVRVWNLATGDALMTCDGQAGIVPIVSSDGRWAVLQSPASDRALNVWDLSSGALVRTCRSEIKSVMPAAILPDLRAVSISPADTVTLSNLASGVAIATFTAESDVRSVAVAPGGTIVVGEQLGRVHFLRIE
jgi:WD40 repeat protein